MRRVVAIFVVAVPMMVLTCAPFALAQAQSFTEHQVFPLTFGVINPCTGEEVIFDSTLRTVLHITQNEGGGAIFVSNGTLHGQGVSSSGAKYVINQFGNVVSKTPTSDTASSPTVAFTIVSNSNVIRTGEPSAPDNFMLRQTFHLTQNANGEFTATVDKTETECR
jgi:hypothetical protein